VKANRVPDDTKYSDMRPHDYKFLRRGVYQTSYARGIRMVGSYSMWNGTRWRPYGQWADYSRSAGFVWRGLSRKPSARMAHTTARILA